MNKVVSEFLRISNYNISHSFIMGDSIWEGARKIAVRTKYGKAEIVFQSEKDIVLYISICCEYDKVFYNWINPNHLSELKNRPKEHLSYSYLEEDKWIRLEELEDVYEKLDGVLNNKDFDKRILIKIEMEDYLFNILAKNAHELDITFNDYICKILQNYLDELAIENEKKNDQI